MSEQLNNPEMFKESVDIGDTVTLHFLDEPDEIVETFRLVSDNSEEDDLLMSVTAQSPVGKAIRGAKRGDIKEFEIPGRQISRVRVINIQ